MIPLEVRLLEALRVMQMSFGHVLCGPSPIHTEECQKIKALIREADEAYACRCEDGDEL